MIERIIHWDYILKKIVTNITERLSRPKVDDGSRNIQIDKATEEEIDRKFGNLSEQPKRVNPSLFRPS